MENKEMTVWAKSISGSNKAKELFSQIYALLNYLKCPIADKGVTSYKNTNQKTVYFQYYNYSSIPNKEEKLKEFNKFWDNYPNLIKRITEQAQ
jgi:hypothetical protein